MKKRVLIFMLALFSLAGCGSNPTPTTDSSKGTPETTTVLPTTTETSTSSGIQHFYSVDIPTIAHRGYAVNEVENTADAFIEAGKRNFIGIETDIYFTKDGWIVCNHNNKVNGMDKNISDCTYEEIMQVNLSTTWDKDVYVCTFNEYLKICKEYKKIPVIEFKTTPSMNNCEIVLEVINKEYGDIDNVIFISFGRKILQQMKTLATANDYHYKIFRLTQSDAQVNEAVEDHMGINHQWDLLTEDIVKKAKDNSLELAVWTLNEETRVQTMIDMGVDYITTDFIECDPKYCK